MAIEILDAELTAEFYEPTQISWIGSVSAEPSDGGYVEPVSRQSRPLLQMTFATWDVSLVRNMFFNTDCGRKAFFIRPPLEALYVFTAKTLGTATGLEQEIQLTVTVGSVSWAALYVDDLTLYANGVEIAEADYTEEDGLITLEPSSTRGGQAITADYQVKYAVRFVEAELSQEIQANDFESIQSATVREIF